MRAFMFVACILLTILMPDATNADTPSILFGKSMLLSTRGIGQRRPRNDAGLYLLLDQTVVSENGLPQPSSSAWKSARLLVGQHTRRNGVQKLHVDFYSDKPVEETDASAFYAEAKRQFADLDVFVVATTSFNLTDISFNAYVDSIRNGNGQLVPFPDNPLAPDRPIAKAVDQFNESTENSRVGSRQPELTVNEVIAAIRSWNRKRNPVDDETLAVYEQIADTGILPDGAKFTFTESSQTDKGRFFVWRIDLDVMAAPNRGYTFRIRDRKLRFIQ